MRLPGGFEFEGRLQTTFAIRPITGEVELAMAEAMEPGLSRAGAVSRVLDAALAEVGGQPVSTAIVRELCVGDRHFLIRHLNAVQELEPFWLTFQCGSCQNRFDIEITSSRLPFKSAGPGFPRTVVATSLGEIECRVPNGADQEAIAEEVDESLAVRRLLERCCRKEPGLELDRLTREDLSRIESALEELAPQVTTRIDTSCPDCDQRLELPLDPCLGLSWRKADRLLDEVHELASTYHWSESAILSLPSPRRMAYLARVRDATLSAARLPARA